MGMEWGSGGEEGRMWGRGPRVRVRGHGWSEGGTVRDAGRDGEAEG